MMNPMHTRPSFALLWALALLILGTRDSTAQLIVGTPTKLGPPIDRGSDGNPELSADGLSLFYTLGSYTNGLNIYVATRESVDSPWNDPQPIETINTRNFEWDPALSPDGRELYFIDGSSRSNFPQRPRPGGLGRGDIWVSLWNDDRGSWGEPQNLGEPINGASNEFGVNLSADGLEIYFSSDRPGGQGTSDLWVARRPSLSDLWGEPTNLGPTLNSASHDEDPAISPDGRMLIFASNRPGGAGGSSSLWVSMREQTEDNWGPPVALNSINGTYWNYGPDLSYDGTMLLYTRWDPGPGSDTYQVPLLPFEAVSLQPSGPTYEQDFDEALTTDTGPGKKLPTGWAISDNELVFQNATNFAFPENGRLSTTALPIYNAGQPEDSDRALTIGVRDRSDAPMLQLLTEVENTHASGFQLQFVVEAWDAAQRASMQGEAAFDVTVDLDTGGGFLPLADLGRVTTGPNLVRPATNSEFLDGNMNLAEFDEIIQADIPVGSQLRFRWTAATDVEATNWIFGLDNVSLRLMGDVTAPELFAGDADQDLDFDQLDLVQVQVAAKYLNGQAATWGEGDWNGAPGGSPGSPPAGDDLFNQLDIVAALDPGLYLTGPYAAIQAGGTIGDGQTSVVYNTGNGEVSIDAPAGTELTSVNIDSAGGIFTGSEAENLGGSFDNDADNNIFKATFGSSFASLSFGTVAQTGLTEEFVLGDLTVIGSLAGGGDLGNVNLVYVPEPTSVLLLSIGLAIGLVNARRVNR